MILDGDERVIHCNTVCLISGLGYGEETEYDVHFDIVDLQLRSIHGEMAGLSSVPTYYVSIFKVQKNLGVSRMTKSIDDVDALYNFWASILFIHSFHNCILYFSYQ